MEELSKRRNVVFVGQGVGCAGTTMTDTLASVPKDKLLEFPVAEDLQMGFCIGLALEGYLPVCIFPRWNFALCAANQIINHLDALPAMGYRPRVIVRTAVPIIHPFNPGPQHSGDYTDAFSSMLKHTEVIGLWDAELIYPSYMAAADSLGSSILVEYTGRYGPITPSGVPDNGDRRS